MRHDDVKRISHVEVTSPENGEVLEDTTNGEDYHSNIGGGKRGGRKKPPRKVGSQTGGGVS